MAERKYTKGEIEKFRKAAGMLAELAEDGAIIYLADDSLHLMTGVSHDDLPNGGSKPRQDRSVAQVYIRRAGGGDW
jgi:hypothetical protein